MELADQADERNPISGTDTALSENSDLEVIRRILFDLELKDLERIKSLLDSPGEFAEAVSKILPEAILNNEQKDSIVESMAPIIKESLHLSISQNPEPMADALFPVMGPAIRKSINDMLRRMISSINQTIEHSLSLQALKWRIQSMVTGKPYAEILLLNSLVYRVKDVFLIHKDTGLLIQHASILGGEALEDNDMISAMMIAIQDFVKDSFRLEESENLGTIQVGDLNLFIETGPRVILAAVVEGEAPAALREKMTDFLERFHKVYNNKLLEFNGDISPYEPVYDDLQQLCEVKQKKKKKKTRSFAAMLILIIIILVAGFFIVRSVDRRIRWRNWMTSIEAEPGIVLTDNGKRNGAYYISGLRDHLAIDPATQMSSFGFEPEKVDFHWESYFSTEKPIVYKRFLNQFNPPSGVDILIEKDTLFLSGQASHTWIEQMRSNIKNLIGISGMNMDRLVDLDLEKLDNIALETQQLQIHYSMGQVRIPANEEEKFNLMVGKLTELTTLAEILDEQLLIVIQGESDTIGNPVDNQRISLSRSAYVKSELIKQGIPESILLERGINDSVEVKDYEESRRCVYLIIKRVE